MTLPQVGVLIATHDRVDDARAGMEVVRSTWEGSELFERVVVVHAYNGRPVDYPEPHLEDRLVVVPDERSHFRGAASLLDAGIAVFAQEFGHVQYVVVMAADVWAYDPRWIAKVLAELDEGGLRLASSRWRIDALAHGLVRIGGRGLLPVDGLATDFFMVDRPWASSSGFFPLRFGEFLDKYADLLNYAQEMPFVERFFAGRFLAAVRSAMEQAPGGKDPWGSAGPRRARELLRLIGERAIDPTGSSAPEHKGHWPDIGLVTSEVAAVKREIVFANAELHGPVLDRLRAGDDLSWYNRLGD